MAVTTVTTTAMYECIGRTIMVTITTIGQDITQTQDIIATTDITITIGILTKTKGRKTTTELIRIIGVKTVVGAEEADEIFFRHGFHEYHKLNSCY
jgi:hypothetical protein